MPMSIPTRHPQQLLLPMLRQFIDRAIACCKWLAINRAIADSAGLPHRRRRSVLDAGKALRVYQEQRTLLLKHATRILGDPARAEDIVHDAWIAACERAEQQDVREFGAYLYLTVRNLAIDALRRNERYQSITGGNFDAATACVPDMRPAADARIISQQELQRFREALLQLPERQRIAVEMHRIGNFKLREIAERLGVSVGYAQELVTHGVARCAQYLKEGR